MELRFTVHGEPKGKGRPGFNTKTGHAITPKDTVIYERETKFPDDVMLDMRIKAYYKIPPSRPRDEKSRTFSSNPKRSYILRTSSRSIRLILSSIVSLAVSLKWTRTI